jgi:hypothetical protein
LAVWAHQSDYLVLGASRGHDSYEEEVRARRLRSPPFLRFSVLIRSLRRLRYLGTR